MKGILVGNWKNHPVDIEAANRILDGLKKHSHLYKKLFTFIAPPAIFFESASRKVKRLGSLASQDINSLPVGTYTGTVSPQMLRGLGVKLSIIGHSEQRRLGESSQEVANKVKTALKAGIIPLVCIGEEVHDPEGNYFGFLTEEIRASLAGLKSSEAAHLILAYEPIWAIGKRGRDAMSAPDLQEMLVFIRKVLTELFGRRVAEKIPILYGGSVEPENAEALAKSGVRGFLVGHASLVPKDFKLIALALLHA